MEQNQGRRALIVGLGIAGAATAVSLHQAGWEMTIAERAAERRRGGFIVVVSPTGLAAAQRLGFESALTDRNPEDATYHLVDRQGRRRPGFDVDEGESRVLLRGDVEQAATEAIPEQVEIRYATTPVEIRQDERWAHVTLRDHNTGQETEERFDLVVGADGVRSDVRTMLFRPDQYRLERMGTMIATTALSTPVPGFDTSEGLTLMERGRSAWTFPMREEKPSVVMSYFSEDMYADIRRGPVESLRKAFGPRPLGPVLSHLIDQFDEGQDQVFDSPAVVRSDRWHKGRVVLLGDSAWCVTLYSGSGASTALAGADLLGTMLQRHGHAVESALPEWERRLRPFVERRQKDGRAGLLSFTPQKPWEMAAMQGRSVLQHLPGVRQAFSKAEALRVRRDTVLDFAS